MPDFSIGVDLGGTNLRIAAVSGDGQLLEKVTLGTKVALGRDHVINEMCDAIQRLSTQYKGAGKLLGAGNAATRPSGMLTRKIDCQPNAWVR